MKEFAPIHTPSLPVPGTRFRNKHGIEWVVDGHLRASSFATQSGDDSGLTEYPVIFPANLSSRTTALLDEVSRCTPKLILPLSTMPTVFPSRAHPGGHTIDAWSHPDHIHIFLDADDVSEVVFAHELAHAWIDLVRGIEDNRVWRDRSDSARYAQVQFIQSFVLDFAVDQVLHEKGFDRSQIIEDLQVASDQLRTATENGYQPKNRREAVFMATHLASILVEDTYDRMPVRQADLFPVVGRNLPEVFTLARSMAQSVLDFFPSNRSTAKTAIDQSLNIAFNYTDPNLDIENHLIHVEPEVNWGIDKFPDWLTGQSVHAKCEIGVAMAAAGATSADIPVLQRENEGPVTVTFHRPDGSVTAPIPLVHAVMPPDQRVARVNELMEDRRRAIANIERRNGINPNPVGSPHRPNVPAQGWQVPSSSPHLPNVPGSQLRSYSPGLARWLTQVRMEEMLEGEHAYSYSDGDPVSFASPGILPLIKPVPPSGPAISPPLLAPPTPGTPLPPPVVGGGAALVIVGGAVAIVDLVRWGCTGNLGPFTGYGNALGERHYDRDQERPAEMRPCPRPPKTRKDALDRRRELLRNYGKCHRIKVGIPREAYCPGGTHQTDIYKCGTKQVSASILCCPCIDKSGVSYYCVASVHLSVYT